MSDKDKVSEIKPISLPTNFMDYLTENGLLNTKDYYQLAKLCNATRYHIKTAIENSCPTTQGVYDAIIEYYSQKKINIEKVNAIMQK